MRIRQVKPDFWSDTVMAGLRPEVRLTYIGLWCESDDAGWFVNDVAAIAHDLYGYEPRATRERHLAAHIEALVAAKRVTAYPCGHAQVPTLKTHQRIAGTQTFRIRDDHFARCRYPSLEVASRSPGKGNVEVRNVEVAPAGADGLSTNDVAGIGIVRAAVVAALGGKP